MHMISLNLSRTGKLVTGALRLDCIAEKNPPELYSLHTILHTDHHFIFSTDMIPKLGTRAVNFQGGKSSALQSPEYWWRIRKSSYWMRQLPVSECNENVPVCALVLKKAKSSQCDFSFFAQPLTPSRNLSCNMLLTIS
jgi:hypothetical protein